MQNEHELKRMDSLYLKLNTRGINEKNIIYFIANNLCKSFFC